MSKKFWEYSYALVYTLGIIALGTIGVVSGQFWTPGARRTVQGDVARILGGIMVVFGTVLLIGWVLAVADGDPHSTDEPAPVPKRFGRPRKRKPQPIDPAEQIAAEALGLEDDAIRGDTGAKPPPSPR